jgi:two-component system chemotaxis response regulator CheB
MAVYPIRVLVVDDSSLARDLIAKGLDADPQLTVVGTACDPYEARDKIVELNPDVLTLDHMMPKMDGVSFLKKLMPQYPLPVVMVSSFTREGARESVEALSAGAVDVIAKPSGDAPGGFAGMMRELTEKVKQAATVDVTRFSRRAPDRPPAVGTFPHLSRTVLAVGASTGGAEAIPYLLRSFPPDMPGTLIVQHMPTGFIPAFADRLDRLSAMTVRVAADGEVVRQGVALVAPGDAHMQLARTGDGYRVAIRPGPKVNGHMPSVDVLFHSVARSGLADAIGVILTGMGGDGAGGLAAMRKAGAKTIGQSEESCVVYGMPKVAYEKGAVMRQIPLEEIPHELMGILRIRTR